MLPLKKLGNAQPYYNLASNPQKTELHLSDLIPKTVRQAKQKKYSRKYPFFEKFKFLTKINKEVMPKVKIKTIIRNFAL